MYTLMKTAFCFILKSRTWPIKKSEWVSDWWITDEDSYTSLASHVHLLSYWHKHGKLNRKKCDIEKWERYHSTHSWSTQKIFLYWHFLLPHEIWLSCYHWQLMENAVNMKKSWLSLDSCSQFTLFCRFCMLRWLDESQQDNVKT